MSSPIVPVNYRGPWSIITQYSVNDCVLQGTTYYLASQPSIGVQPPGVGWNAVSVSTFGMAVQPWPIFNVKDYGALGNGSTDDTASIQSAISAASTAGGGVVLVPQGTFLVTGLTLPSNIILQGQGNPATTIKLKTGSNASVITSTGFAGLTGTNPSSLSGTTAWEIRDLLIDGNASGQTGHSTGVEVFAYNYKLTNVEVYNCLTDGLYTEFVDFTADHTHGMETRVHNCRFTSNGNNGVTHYGPSDSMYSNTFFIHSGNYGFLNGAYAFSSNGGTLLSQCHSWGFNQQWCYVVDGHSAFFTGCVADGGVVGNLWIKAGGGVSWIGGTFVNGSQTQKQIKLGDSIGVTTAQGCKIITTIFNPRDTALVFDNSGGYNDIKVTVITNATDMGVQTGFTSGTIASTDSVEIICQGLTTGNNLAYSSRKLWSGNLQTQSNLSASSGIQYGLQLLPTITQSGTASYTALLVNVTETSAGNGGHSLFDLQKEGVSQFVVGRFATIDANSPYVKFTGGPDVTANYGQLSVGHGGFNGGGGTNYAGNSAGGILALNTSSGWAGDLINAQVAGVSKLLLQAAGTASSGTDYGLRITPTFAQSGSASYAALSVNMVESSAGSGNKRLLELMNNGFLYFGIDRFGTGSCSGTNFQFTATPSSSATNALVNIGNGGFISGVAPNFVGSASGTNFAINNVSGYAGDLINAQVAGSSKFLLDKSGNITAAGVHNNESIAIDGGQASSTRIETVSRNLITNQFTSVSQTVYLTMFTADKTLTASNILVCTGATQTAAGAQHCRFGIYTVDGSGNSTLVAATADDSTLLAAQNTLYTKALTLAGDLTTSQTTYTLTKGSRYAIGVFWQGTGLAPTIMCIFGKAPMMALTPVCNGSRATQTDLTTSNTVANAPAASTTVWAGLT